MNIRRIWLAVVAPFATVGGLITGFYLHEIHAMGDITVDGITQYPLLALGLVLIWFGAWFRHRAYVRFEREAIKLKEDRDEVNRQKHNAQATRMTLQEDLDLMYEALARGRELMEQQGRKSHISASQIFDRELTKIGTVGDEIDAIANPDKKKDK